MKSNQRKTVILLNIAGVVPLDARIDGHRDHQAEGRRVGCVDSRGSGDVSVNDKLGDILCNGDSHKTDMFSEKRTNMYSLFSLRPSKVRATSTRPLTWRCQRMMS